MFFHVHGRKADMISGYAEEGLLSLIAATGGNETWFKAMNWHEANDPCEITTRWFGVGCYDPCDFFRDGLDCIAGRVTSL